MDSERDELAASEANTSESDNSGTDPEKTEDDVSIELTICFVHK